MAGLLLNALAAIGGLVVLYFAYSFYDFLTLHLFRPSPPLDAYKRSGSEQAWALITGAGAGMGLGAGTELIRQGFGVILLGNLEDELAEAKQTIESSHPGAAVRTVVMDVQTATPDELTALVDSIKHLNITILMNHVGGNPIVQPAMRGLSTYSIADVDAVIDVNARFMARLTTLMLPILSRKPDQPGKRSLIINTSSGGNVGLPWIIMYSASKAFVRSFSYGLARELEGSAATKHIDCLCLIPGDVLSKSNHIGVTGEPLAGEYGKWIVHGIDGVVRRGMRDVTPYWKHDLQIRAIAWLGEGIKTQALAQVVDGKKKAWEDYHQKTS